MPKIIKILGGNSQTAKTIAGIGDLIATGCSENSSNHQLGYELGSQGQSTVQSEGFRSLPSIKILLSSQAKEFPLFLAVHKIVVAKEDTMTTFDNYLRK